MPSVASGTSAVRERSPGHFELRAYNPATGRRLIDSLREPRTASREQFTAFVARWKPKRLPLIPHERSLGTSASAIFVT
jgi:hypothetical protein